MEIIIQQAILHVLDTTMDAPVLSGGGMELTAEKNRLPPEPYREAAGQRRHPPVPSPAGLGVPQ